jgi:transcriptional regulator with XRE-family HTH domain
MSLLWEKNIGEVEFCKTIGINKSAITDWKRGKTKSYEKHIKKIADFFNMPESFFSNKLEFNLDNFTSHVYDKYDEQFLNLFHMLNEEGRRAAVAHVEFLTTQGDFKKPLQDEMENA